MFGYILRCFLQVILVFFGVILFIYFFVFVMFGDLIFVLFGDCILNFVVVVQLCEQYYFNDLFFVQYWYYIIGVFQGDFGMIFLGCLVLMVFVEMFFVMGCFVVMVIGIEFVFVIIIGIIFVLCKGKLFDYMMFMVVFVVFVILIFVVVFFVQYFFVIKFGWFKLIVGLDNDWGGFWLFVIVFGFSFYVVSMWLMWSLVIDIFNQDWVCIVYSKGFLCGCVILVYVLWNLLILVIINLVMNFGVFFVGVIVIEGIFNVFGVGNMFYQVVICNEGFIVVFFVIVFVIFYVLVNFIIDLFYGLFDLRICYV